MNRISILGMTLFFMILMVQIGNADVFEAEKTLFESISTDPKAPNKNAGHPRGWTPQPASPSQCLELKSVEECEQKMNVGCQWFLDECCVMDYNHGKMPTCQGDPARQKELYCKELKTKPKCNAEYADNLCLWFVADEQCHYTYFRPNKSLAAHEGKEEFTTYTHYTALLGLLAIVLMILLIVLLFAEDEQPASAETVFTL
jgi:hypothetical protein